MGVLFLNGGLLLDIPPGADFQAAADPTERLGPSVGGFGAANRTLETFPHAIHGNGALGLFQDLGGNYRLEFGVRLPLHLASDLLNYGRNRLAGQPNFLRVGGGYVPA
jgi:hypothetical protein